MNAKNFFIFSDPYKTVSSRKPNRFVLFAMVMIAAVILSACQPQASPVPTATLPAATVEASANALVSAGQSFVDQLNKGDFAGAFSRFDNTLKAAMPEAKLKETWQGIGAQSGAYKSQLGTRTEEKSGYRIVYVTCQFEKSVIDVQVVFNNMGQISGLFFKPGTAPGATPKANPEYNAAARTVVDQLSKGDYAGALARFDSSLKASLNEGVLKQAWTQLIDKVGAFNQCGEPIPGDLQGYATVTLPCDFVNGKMDVRFVFNEKGGLIGMNFLPPNSASATPVPYNPPAYANPSTFKESAVTVGSGKWALPGTLAMPNGSGPFPAVVLVHGSGPNDRDETIGPNKPFKDLAWGLASQGIAVLRYDKRTNAHAMELTPDIVAKLTVKEETIDDALLAAQLLRQTQGIDPKRVYVLGHSLGATLAPRIGQQDSSLAGLIIMAGMTIPLEDELLRQVEYLNSLSGTQTDQQKADFEKLKKAVARVKDPNLSENTPASELPLGVSPAYWLDLRAYKPAEVAKSLAMPLMILQGERDYQVTADQDFTGWKTALAQKTNVVFKLYPGLNHLFLLGQGAPNPSEYETPGHVSADVVKDIVEWIKGK